MPSPFDTYYLYFSFYFTEQTKISSTTGGENSIVQMLGSLYTCLENDYGSLSTRLYRAFRPRPGKIFLFFIFFTLIVNSLPFNIISVSSTSDWKWRRLCCIPYFLIILTCFLCTLIGISLLVLSLLLDTKDK